MFVIQITAGGTKIIKRQALSTKETATSPPIVSSAAFSATPSLTLMPFKFIIYSQKCMLPSARTYLCTYVHQQFIVCSCSHNFYDLFYSFLIPQNTYQYLFFTYFALKRRRGHFFCSLANKIFCSFFPSSFAFIGMQISIQTLCLKYTYIVLTYISSLYARTIAHKRPYAHISTHLHFCCKHICITQFASLLNVPLGKRLSKTRPSSALNRLISVNTCMRTCKELNRENDVKKSHLHPCAA